MKMRAAVIGCGAMANGAHLPNIATSDEIELCAVCDVHSEVAVQAQKDWGAGRHETDWRALTGADDIDLIVLCTHSSLRGEVICEALRHGIAVYTEKPLSESASEMAEILAVHKETGVPVCVGHNRRSSPAMLEFKRLVDKARVEGADRGAIIDRLHEKKFKFEEEDQTQTLIRINDDVRTWKGWIYDDEAGIILQEMVHFIDLALWLNDSAPSEVYASGSNRGNFTEIIRFEDGSQATITHSMVGNFDYPKELFEIGLRNVTICLDHHMEVRQRGLDSEAFRTSFPLGTGTEVTDKVGMEAFYEASDRFQEIQRQGGELPAMSAFPEKGHNSHLHRFAAHIRGDGENPCPLESAIEVTDIALRLLESVKSGQPIKLQPEDLPGR